MERDLPTYKVYFCVLPSDIIQRDMPNVPNWEVFARVEKSVTSHGFHNPILVQCGWDAKRGYVDPTYLAADRMGGTRLLIAKKHGLYIPCIVSDFMGRFADCELLHNDEAICSKFKNPPTNIEHRPSGLACDPPCDHRKWM